MRRALRFIFALIVGLALLTWGASSIVNRTTRRWSEKDIALRSHLAVTGAHAALGAHWGPARTTQLRDILVDIARDERIMGAAACKWDLATLASTADYPPGLSCKELGMRAGATVAAGSAASTAWTSVIALRGGNVHVTAVPLVKDDEALGFVVLVHDLSFIERREATTRVLILLAFGLLALAASVTTVAAARMSWRGWSDELRRLLKGDKPRAEFVPFLRDVRDLVDRLASEREMDGLGGLWTPQRLKNTLSRYLHGERVVIVANREPCFHTQFHCNNFIDTVDRFLEARIDREQTAVVHRRQCTLVRPYPISVECPNSWAKASPAPAECRAAVFAELRLAPNALLGVGVDRLDYTKGIEERLLAVERLLTIQPALCGRFTFVELAAPSRTAIPQYRDLGERVARLAERLAPARRGHPIHDPLQGQERSADAVGLAVVESSAKLRAVRVSTLALLETAGGRGGAAAGSAGSSTASKLVSVCGRPSSVSRKSSFFNPTTGAPSFPATTASTVTTSTSARKLGAAPAGRSSATTPPPRPSHSAESAQARRVCVLLIGPCLPCCLGITGVPQRNRSDTSVTLRRATSIRRTRRRAVRHRHPPAARRSAEDRRFRGRHPPPRSLGRCALRCVP